LIVDTDGAAHPRDPADSLATGVTDTTEDVE
jgi:hypothetical protein